MRSRLRVALMVGFGMAVGAATASLGADVTDDPYVWLEDIYGQLAVYLRLSGGTPPRSVRP